MIGFRVNYGETHAVILVDESDHRTDVTLACGPVMKIDATNTGRFALITETPTINCFICQEKTEGMDAEPDPESEARREAMNSGRHPAGKRRATKA